MYNEDQRRKILKWFYHILHSNYSIELDNFWNASELKMISQNPQSYFKMQLNASEFNITEDYMNDFLDKLKQMTKVLNHNSENNNLMISNYTASECTNYCNGAVRDFVDEYKSLHGYISLVVSNNSMLIFILMNLFLILISCWSRTHIQ